MIPAFSPAASTYLIMRLGQGGGTIPTPTGRFPTRTVATTVLVAVRITETMLEK
jgi:hypothetical protein